MAKWISGASTCGPETCRLRQNIKDIPFIGLPGNPVSAFVGFEVFVRPTIQRLSGSQIWRQANGPCAMRRSDRFRWSRKLSAGEVREENGVLTARLTGHQGSATCIRWYRQMLYLLSPLV
jgi:molybdopterin biosynthesis enzyme